MGATILTLLETFAGAMRDVVPIVIILAFFQLVVLRKTIPRLNNVLGGFVLVIAGLALFLVGLEQALFPLGRMMAVQLTDPAFIAPGADPGANLPWYRYGWVYLFAAAIGFSTTVAEPALIAVSLKANTASGGTLHAGELRLAVALGVSIAVVLGAFRIITGAPLALFMMIGYVVVIVQTLFAPKAIIPLAYDSGGVTTSTVTVPLVTALGLGLASTVPGRSALLDGFGLIALASLFPMITVMGYAQISEWKSRARPRKTPLFPLEKDRKNEIQTDNGADLGRQDRGGVSGGPSTGGDRLDGDNLSPRRGSETGQDLSRPDT